MSDRCNFRDCVSCPCFLKDCIAVVNVGNRRVKVYDVCCRSCIDARVSVG